MTRGGLPRRAAAGPSSPPSPSPSEEHVSSPRPGEDNSSSRSSLSCATASDGQLKQTTPLLAGDQNRHPHLAAVTPLPAHKERGWGEGCSGVSPLGSDVLGSG